MAAVIDLVVPSLLLFGCYLALARRAAWPPARSASFAAGLALLAAGLAVDGASLPAHMAGHGVVVALAAPLLVLGRPLTLLLRGLPRPAARDLARLLRAPALRAALWPPLAWAAFVAVQLAFHLTPLFGAALHDEPLHALEHLLFLATALWLWTVCLAVEPLPRPWPPLARAGLLMAAMMLSDIGSVKLMVDGEAAAGAAMTAAMLPLGLGAAAIVWSWLLREERRARRTAIAATALLLATFALTAWSHSPTASPHLPASALAANAPTASAPTADVSELRGSIASASSDTPLGREGRRLFEEGCTSCHGFDGGGVPGRGPSLAGAGEAAADFYLQTGRMPLGQVGEQPLRAPPHYSDAEIRALDAYVGSLGAGPAIPVVRPERGSLSEGMRLFTESCAGCHGIGGKGGVAIGAYAPPLGEATPTEVGEAIRVGPYVMPRFSAAQLDSRDVDSIARYVRLTQDPDDAGGLGIGHIGPVPEGLVAWLAALAALLLVARLIGERGDAGPPDEPPPSDSPRPGGTA